MSKIHTNNELDSFVFDMKPQSIFNPEVGLDKIWQRLLEDVCDYETRKNNPMYSECVPKNYSLEQSDRPDIIYQTEDYVMGIECFEFDASRKTRKGSMQKQKMHEANCEANKDYGNTAYIEKISDSKEKHPTNKPSVIKISCF